ncbi:MAG: type II toxin-antitoxin system HicB family antitoxin [Comamonadaceae bacterium]|nr:type II toxin-antitoxin system HicB family antitoxin [Comamonadaceae bacterium]
MNRFEIIIFWSDEDHCFVADVPELPGCMAHGESHEAALAAVKQAMQLWLDTAQSMGRSVPQARGSRLMFA